VAVTHTHSTKYSPKGAVTVQFLEYVVVPLLIALVGGTAYKKLYTVPPGHQGIKFLLGKPVRGADGLPRIYNPGWPPPFIIPGIHRLSTTQASMCNTANDSISVNFCDGSVWLTRITLVFHLNPMGVVRALCEATANFDRLTTNSFHQVVGDVCAEQDPATGRDKLVRLILEAARISPALQAFGVGPDDVAIAELSPGPATQTSAPTQRLVDMVAPLADAFTIWASRSSAASTGGALTTTPGLDPHPIYDTMSGPQNGARRVTMEWTVVGDGAAANRHN